MHSPNGGKAFIQLRIKKHVTKNTYHVSSVEMFKKQKKTLPCDKKESEKLSFEWDVHIGFL